MARGATTAVIGCVAVRGGAYGSGSRAGLVDAVAARDGGAVKVQVEGGRKRG